MSPKADLESAFGAIDAVNARDPHILDWRGTQIPRSLLQGQRATLWLGKVASSPSTAVCIAARAHHLGRWQLGRSSDPDGRVGYLRWRTASKAASAELLVATLAPLGVAPPVVQRAVALVQRNGLGSDDEVQTIEDVACLVFLETDYVALLQRLGREKTARAVLKTIKKMSTAALGLGVDATPAGPARELLLEVAAT